MISENALSYLIYYCSLYNQRGLIAKNSTQVAKGDYYDFWSINTISITRMNS